MQKIEIRNSGPVKAFGMEIKRFNLLIGEQATGKSTIAKAIYFFQVNKRAITNYLIQICETNSYNGKSQERINFYKAIRHELKDVFIQLFGYSWDLNPDTEMTYYFTDNVWIKVALHDGDKPGKKLIGVDYSPEIMVRIRELKEEAQDMFRNNANAAGSLALAKEERKRNRDIIIQKVNEFFRDEREVYYIPAGRSLLTVMSNSRAVMNSVTSLDLITENFMSLIDNIRNNFMNGVRKVHQFYPIPDRKFDVNEMAERIIKMQKGEYCYVGGREKLLINGDKRHSIGINFASSGQQEILWLLNFLYVLMLRQENAFVIIEEPEAHIYPTLQKEVMEFIAMFGNMQNSGVFVTTHSPYILTAANNLFYAGAIAELRREAKVRKVVDRRCVLSPRDFSAYKLLMSKDGDGSRQYVDLVNEEGMEIHTSLIDDISSEINEVYTMLYDLELEE